MAALLLAILCVFRTSRTLRFNVHTVSDARNRPPFLELHEFAGVATNTTHCG